MLSRAFPCAHASFGRPARNRPTFIVGPFGYQPVNVVKPTLSTRRGCAILNACLSGSVRMSPPKRIIVLAAFALAFVAGAAVVMAVRLPTAGAAGSIQTANSTTH